MVFVLILLFWDFVFSLYLYWIHRGIFQIDHTCQLVLKYLIEFKSSPLGWTVHLVNDSCNCVNCEKERVEKVKFYDFIPTDFLGSILWWRVGTKDVKSFSFKEKLYISSLLAVSDYENYTIYKINKDFWKLAPYVLYQKKILKYLVDLGIIEYRTFLQFCVGKIVS